MEPTPQMRLRTAVMIAGMTILPIAAVLGFRNPWGNSTSKHDTSRSAMAAPAGGTAAGAQTSAGADKHPQSHLADVHGHSHDSHTDDHDHAEHAPGFLNSPIQQASNRDVRATSAELSPASFAADLHDHPLPTPGGRDEPPTSTAAETSTGDRFSQIQQRLRALGATHYALETWGPQNELYRFQCRMAAGHQPGYTRQFEATDTDALSSMQTVLHEVEAWKSGRLP